MMKVLRVKTKYGFGFPIVFIQISDFSEEFHNGCIPHWVGGVMKFTISCVLTLQMLHIKFGYNWTSGSWQEDVIARLVMDDDRRQPIALGHLTDSGDIKKFSLYHTDFNID